MFSKIIKAILFSCCFFVYGTAVNADPKVDNKIFSPEEFGPAFCVGCCDENGNQLPSHPVCGCDPVDVCGVCNGNGSSCACQLFDCAGKPFPDSTPYCHLDVNGDKKITAEDVQSIKDYINGRGDPIATEKNKNLDTSDDGMITPQDSLLVINFLNSNIDGVTQVDSCGICGGSGYNECGTCTNAPDAVFPEGPNGICGCPTASDYVGSYDSECKICSDLGKDSCNRCPGTPNYNDPNCCPAGQVDVGCGCGNPGPSGCDNVCGSTKVDLGCGCGVSGPSGCDHTCGSNKVVDACGLCGGDGTSCPKACEYIKASIARVGDQNKFSNASLRKDEVFKTTGEATGLSCITNMINAIYERRKHRGKYMDDEMAIQFSDQYLGVQGKLDPTQGNVYINKTTDTYHCESTIWSHEYGGKNYCANGYFVMDKQCRIVPLSHLDETCGELKVEFIRSSPISLVWEDGAHENEEISLVSFPINPTLDGKSYMWKGSSKLPLIVYDPDHTGKISSASQLFGNWTFGGKTSASISDSNASAIGKPWQNGYEALATLDTNFDGKISGEELSPLGIWFDSNMDGISQPGEVKRLSDVNVTALFYKADKVDELRNNIVASRGYEVIIDGKPQIRTSIDWFAATADSKYDLMKSAVLKTLKFGEGKSTIIKTEDKVSPYASSTNKEFDKRWSGAWKWSLAEDENVDYQNQGVLLLDVTKEGKVTGHSLIPHAFKKSPGVETSMALAFLRIEGSRSGTVDGVSTVNFEIKDGNSLVKTEVSLSDDGSELRGTSVAQVDNDGATQKIRYSWVAERLDVER